MRHRTGKPHRPRGPLRVRTLRRLVLLAAALAVLALADRAGLFRGASPDLPRYDNQQTRVVRSVDGDTFEVDIPDQRHGRPTTTIRLWGVDTPETRHPTRPVEHFGPQAAAFTRELTEGRLVLLRLLDRQTRDRYERVLAYVYLSDGRMLNRVLIETGHAYADPRFDHPERRQFESLMDRARRDRQGLWADARPQDLPYYLRDQ